MEGEVYRGNPNRRRAIYEIDAQILVELFKAGRRSYEVTENAIPDDARVYGAQYDALRDVWRVGLESEFFDVVDDGVMPPLMAPTVMIRHEDE